MHLLEIFLVVLLVAAQAYVFGKNIRLIRILERMYPAPAQIQLYRLPLEGAGGEAAFVDLIALEGETSTEIRDIVEKTNGYLRNNRGAAADFGILRDISERASQAREEEIQAQVATPLYLGLLGTFLGAIAGLWQFNVTDEGVTDFLGGIRVAMTGSFVGLGLTLLGNEAMKRARTRRDRLKDEYYTFLQTALLPKLNSDMQRGLGELKAVLDTFNRDFFAKIQEDFFSKLGQLLPLVRQMTENIVIQKDFLEKLQTIGYTELANATIRVFDRVDQSATTFEKFLGYQTALNHTIQQGTELTNTLAALLSRLRAVEQAAEQLPDFLAQHDNALRQMVEFFKSHQGTLANIRAGMEQRLDQSARSLDGIVDKRIREMEAEYQLADEKLRHYFASLNDQNVYDKVVRYLQPFSELPTTQTKLNQLQERQAQQTNTALTQLQQRLEADEQIQRALLAQVKRLADIEEEMARRGVFGRLFGRKGSTNSGSAR